MSKDGNAYIWHRAEYVDRLDELGTFAECGALVGGDGARTISGWHNKYEDFPKIVCQAGERPAAKKYLVKTEFAEWLVRKQSEELKRDEQLYKRLRAKTAKVKQRVEDRAEDLRIAKSVQEKWSKKH